MYPMCTVPVSQYPKHIAHAMSKININNSYWDSCQGRKIRCILLAFYMKDSQILILYSEESDVWIPESKEFCLMCFRVGGGLLSSNPSTRLHEQGKDSGPLEGAVPFWLEPKNKNILRKLLYIFLNY